MRRAHVAQLLIPLGIVVFMLLSWRGYRHVNQKNLDTKTVHMPTPRKMAERTADRPTALPVSVTQRSTIQSSSPALSPPTQSSILNDMRQFLDKMTDFDQIDYETLDKLTVRFLDDPSATREAKISLLISELRNRSSIYNPATKYAIDLLAALKPVENIDELISIASSMPLDDTKIEMIGLLQECGYFEDVDDLPLDPARFASSIATLKSYLATLAANIDSEVAARALHAYCAIAAPDESLATIDYTIKNWLKLAVAGTAQEMQTSHTHLLQQLLDSAIATPETQNAAIPEFCRLLAAFPRSQIELVDNLIYEVALTADLTPAARRALGSYLVTSEPGGEATSRYYHWLTAVSSLQSESDAPQSRFAATVLGQTDTIKAASAIVYADHEWLAPLSPADLSRLRERLLSAQSDVTNQEDADFITDALERLDELSAPD